MADRQFEDKTEDPTPLRLQRARRAGQIAVSRDLGTGFAALALCVVVLAGGNAWIGGLVAYLHTAFAGANGSCAIEKSLLAGLGAACVALAFPLGSLLVVASLAGLVQTRGNIAVVRARPEGKRILPSWRRIAGREGVAEAGKSWLKIVVLVAVAWWTLGSQAGALAASAGVDSYRLLRMMGALAQALGIRLALALLVLGVADYLWQLHRHRKALRMTREEARREHKESEGDPLHKAERQRIHHELNEL
jgi:type III secretion protein U